MLLIVFSQLVFDGFVEELDVVLDAEVVEEIFWQRELDAHVRPAANPVRGASQHPAHLPEAPIHSARRGQGLFLPLQGLVVVFGFL
jgi:hypothetical protein